MNRDQFYKKIDSFNDELINLRRHIHAHPELSGLENQWFFKRYWLEC